jgi:choline dehydrogenase-like flavoprotein
MAQDGFDFVVIGSGFGSLFFIRKLLERRPDARIAVLEWGRSRDHAWQIANRRNGDIRPDQAHRQKAGQKPWNYTIGFGGGTNCWFGQAMRMLPNDFRMRSTYGALQDWPFSYDDLEPYYLEAEQIMQISGPDELAIVSPRSGPYPVPAHRTNAVDDLMLAARPNEHFKIATARAPVPVPGRNPCCATSRCNLCPADAKFSLHNGMADLIDHKNITYTFEAEVRALEWSGNKVTAVVYRHGGSEKKISGDVIVLGANAIHSPAILLRSGITHPTTGEGLCEQLGADFELMLKGVESFGGGTITTSLNFGLYEGPHRADSGAAMIFFDNRVRYGLRPEFGRWRECAPIIVNVEDAPEARNKVTVDSDGYAFVDHPGVSDYARRGLARARIKLPEVLAPLPVEQIIFHGIRPTESHLQCTLRSGADPATSVIDGRSIHHRLRNLVVVGSAAFTTCPPPNPSLTVAAMALRAADLWTKASA